MAASTFPGSTGSYSVDISDGTLCRLESPKAGAIGNPVVSASKPKIKVKVLGFDGVKVYGFLYVFAQAEIEWQNLRADPQAAIEEPVPKQQYIDRASALYGDFLAACSKGPRPAKTFFEQKHALLKQYTQQSQAILQSLQDQVVDREAYLSVVAFGLQVTKSLATIAMGAIPLYAAFMIVSLPTVAAAGVGITYDVFVEYLKPSEDEEKMKPDHVVIGFRQTLFNDKAGLWGGLAKDSSDEIAAVKKMTLLFPKKSSIYRSAVTLSSRLDHLLKGMGILSLLTTLWTEEHDTIDSFNAMQKARRANSP